MKPAKRKYREKAQGSSSAPQHKVGAVMCGYQLFEDGSIKPAQSYTDIMDSALIERLALEELTMAFLAQSQKLMTQIKKQERYFWEQIKTDYAADMDYSKFRYAYDMNTKIVSREPIPSEETK